MKRKADQISTTPSVEDEDEEWGALAKVNQGTRYVRILSVKYHLGEVVEQAERNIFFGDSFTSFIFTELDLETSQKQSSRKLKASRHEKPQNLIANINLCYFLMPSDWIFGERADKPFILTLVRVKSYQVFSIFPAMEIILMNNEMNTVFREKLDGRCYALTIIMAIRGKLFGFNRDREERYSTLNPAAVPALSITFKYNRENNVFSESMAISKEVMESIHNELYPGLKKMKDASKEEIENIKIMPLTSIADHTLSLVEKLSPQINIILDKIYKKVIKYDLNFVLEDMNQIISSIYVVGASYVK
jgi:hypothetical protein